jgi:hypothetical protein
MEEDPAQNGVQSFGSKFTILNQNLKKHIPKWPIYYWVFIVVLAIALILGTIYLYLSPQLKHKLFNNPEPTPVPPTENTWVPAKPAPAPLAPGKQVYTISGGKKGAPQMTMATIDPLDVKKGQLQTFTVEANDVKDISTINAEVITDNEKKTYPLKLHEGTDNNGAWTGSWRINDTFDYHYQIRITAKNSEGLESAVTLSFR